MSKLIEQYYSKYQMHRNTLFSFDILSSKHRRTTKQIQLPLIEDNASSNDRIALLNLQTKKINDQSIITKNNSHTKFVYCCRFLQRYVPVTRPQSSYLFFWNLINLFIILYNFIQIPIMIFVANSDFKNKQEIHFLKTMEILSIVVLFLDTLLMRFKIGYYKNEDLISTYYQLIPHYLKFQFIFDIIPFLALIIYLVATGMNLIFVKILFYLKLFTLFQINEQIEIKLLFSPYIRALYKFLRMVYFIFFVTSLIACIYFSIDFSYYNEQGFYYQNGYLWLIGSQNTDLMNLIEIYTWPVWYAYALYWAVQTSSGVGYGNMTPRNSPQVFLCNVVMLTTICMFVIFADTVISIVNELQQNNQRKQNKLIQLNYFSRVYEVKNQSKKKLDLFVQSLIKQNEEEDQRYLQQILSTKLRINFKLSYKQQFINNLSILKILTWENEQWNFFAKDIISSIKSIHYSKGDFIIKNQVTNNFILGFIARGKITISNKVNDYQKDYREWEYFGQKEFFFGGKTYNQIICRTFTKFFYFQQSIFFNLIKKYQNLRDTCYHHIDSVRFDKKQASLFGIHCQNCDQSHLLLNCSISNEWRLNLDKIVDRSLQSLHTRWHSERNNLISSKVIHFSFPKQLSSDKVYNSSCYFPHANLQI